jgi:hypothetical protein
MRGHWWRRRSWGRQWDLAWRRDRIEFGFRQSVKLHVSDQPKGYNCFDIACRMLGG